MKLVGIMAAVLEYVLTSSGAIKIDASRVKDIQLFSSFKFSSISIKASTKVNSEEILASTSLGINLANMAIMGWDNQDGNRGFIEYIFTSATKKKTVYSPFPL